MPQNGDAGLVMIEENQLKELLAPMLMLPAGKIGRETSLASLHNSLGEAKLRLALKRYGADLPVGLRPPTFDALDRALHGSRPAPPPAAQEMPGDALVTPFGSPFQHLRIGLDDQDIGSLPICGDY